MSISETTGSYRVRGHIRVYLRMRACVRACVRVRLHVSVRVLRSGIRKSYDSFEI